MQFPDLDGASLPELSEYMEHQDHRLREDAACALGDRLRTLELRQLETALLEKLAGLLDDPVFSVRVEAAIALAEAKDSRAETVLLQAVGLRSYRLDAIRALGRLSRAEIPAAVEKLQKLLRKRWSAWADRMQAAAALCALGERDGAIYLEEKLNSRRTAERAAAIHFLGESKHPNAFSLLLSLLESEDPMQDVAARALGLLGDARAKDRLMSIRSNAHEELQEDIDAALDLLSRRVEPA